MSDQDRTAARVRWARLRFSIIGPLLSSPPPGGELGKRIAELASQPWRHPSTGESLRFSAKTIERWYYTAARSETPIESLARKVPKHAGTHRAISEALGQAIEHQYRQHPRWSYQLHYDNLMAQRQQQPELGDMPAYMTVVRYMKDQGLLRQKRKQRKGRPVSARERRSFEVRHVHGMWHLDFHEGSRNVYTASGKLFRPQLLAILDDCSRLCCHAQWYLHENTESLIHGLCQAIQKRGLPRSLLTDNGSAMIAAETREGLERLSITHHTTLPRTPEQNAKSESWWNRAEGRLLPMLEGVPKLTLSLLNKATQAFVEQEYHHKDHGELNCSPMARYLSGPNVGRQSPNSETLRRAFRMEVTRAQRKSDGTVTVEGVRFEVPWAYNTLRRVHLRVARWDLSSVAMVDGRTGSHLATLLPLDKEENANRRRRPIAFGPPRPPLPPAGIAPHLRALMEEYAATGLPPAYLPKDDTALNGEDTQE